MRSRERNRQRRKQAEKQWADWLAANGGNLAGAIKQYGTYEAVRLAYLAQTAKPKDSA